MENNDTLERVLKNFRRSASYRQDKEKQWKRYYRMYRCRAEAQQDQTRANLFIPEVFTTVETLLPRLVSRYLNTNRSIVEVLAREETDVENAKQVQMLLDYQFERMKLPFNLVAFYKQALLYGTSVGKVYWDYRTREDDLGKVHVLYDDPVFEVLDLFDFFIDPDSMDIQDARYCIHRKYLSLKELEQRQKRGIYKNVDQLKAICTADSSSISPPAEERHNAIEPDDRDVEILEYWEDDRIVVVGGRKVVLRDEKNPFYHGQKPFVNIVFVPVPFEFYGIGVVEPIEGLQHEINTKRNQRLDNVNLILNRMWLIQRGAIDDLRQLRSRPGGVIIVNDMNGIQPLPAPDVTSSSYMEEDKIKMDIQNTTGVSDYIRGVMSSERQTATEVQIKSEQSASRFEFNFRLMAEMGLKRIARMVIQLDQQFIRKERVIRILGDQGPVFNRVTPEQIVGNFDLIPSVDPSGIHEAEKKKQIMSVYSALAGNPSVNARALAKKILETFEIPDSDEILTQQLPGGGEHGYQLPGEKNRGR